MRILEDVPVNVELNLPRLFAIAIVKQIVDQVYFFLYNLIRRNVLNLLHYEVLVLLVKVSRYLIKHFINSEFLFVVVF